MAMPMVVTQRSELRFTSVSLLRKWGSRTAKNRTVIALLRLAQTISVQITFLIAPGGMENSHEGRHALGRHGSRGRKPDDASDYPIAREGDDAFPHLQPARRGRRMLTGRLRNGTTGRLNRRSLSTRRRRARSRSSRGPGHRPLTAATGVRIPYGTPPLWCFQTTSIAYLPVLANRSEGSPIAVRFSAAARASAAWSRPSCSVPLRQA